ncbi:P-type conjugative transfer protein VirB9 [Gallibacterium anatis]|uniref:P-type conjugative transfer protein VirB9 n=1 Tax=Gallibacterium anatis TaxID=750 RepID=UPI003006FC21
MKRTLLTLTLASLISANVIGAEDPKRSKYDDRMQYIDYNPAEVTTLRTKSGLITRISFGKDEKIIDAMLGFSDGWKSIYNGNSLYITAQSVAQGEQELVPTAGEWDTNLLVVTDKHEYAFDIKLINDNSKFNTYNLTFQYPDQEELERKSQLMAIKAEQARIKAEQDKFRQIQATNAELDKFTVPKNWDYLMKVGANSREIAPVFTYDDGVRTYIGFDTTASIPAVFYYQGEQEMMSNVSPKQQGKYTVIVVHKVAQRLILRSGDQVVGLINNGFGKNPAENSLTSQSNVTRAIK